MRNHLIYILFLSKNKCYQHQLEETKKNSTDIRWKLRASTIELPFGITITIILNGLYRNPTSRYFSSVFEKYKKI